jgi:hypothetical protein
MSWKILSPCVTRDSDGTSRPPLQPRKQDRSQGSQLSRPSSTPKPRMVADGDAQRSCEQPIFTQEIADDDEALSLHNPVAPFELPRHGTAAHNKDQGSRKTGRWGEMGDIWVARTTPASRSRFPACGDPVAGAWPSLRSASSPRHLDRQNPTFTNIGESPSISSRGFRRIDASSNL